MIRLIELRAEVVTFLMDHNAQLVSILNDENWVSELTYLADMLSKTSEMNLSLQEETVTVFKAMTKCQLLRGN